MSELDPIPTTDLLPADRPINGVISNLYITSETPLFTTFEDSLANQTLDIQEQSLALNESGLEVSTEEVLGIGSTILVNEIELAIVENNIPTLEWQTDERGNNVLTNGGLKTTFPAEFFAQDALGRLYMPAASVDGLSPGSYSVDVSGSSGEITIIENENGRFMRASSTRNDRVMPRTGDEENYVGMRALPPSFGGYGFAEGLATQLSGREDPSDPGSKVLEKFGYTFDYESNGRTIPTPDTMANLAESNGAPIEVVTDVDDSGRIPVRRYLQSFADGKYPIGAGDLSIYAHDVRSNDHMLGVLALGREGLDMLSPVAKSVLGAESEFTDRQLGDVAEFYDTVTANISSIIQRPTSEYMNNNFGTEQNGAATLGNLGTLCQSISDQAVANSTIIDPDKLLEHLKTRFKQMHEEHDFGADFGNFLEALKDYKVPAPVEKAQLETTQSRTFG